MEDIIFKSGVIGFILNGEVYGDRAAVTRLPAEDMGPAMFTLANAVAGQQVTFVDDFTHLDDINRLIRRLEEGEDVALELAYNKITVPEGLDDARDHLKVARAAQEAAEARSKEAKRQLDALLGTVRETLKAVLEERRRERFRQGVLTPEQEKVLRSWKFSPTRMLNPSGYTLGVKTGKKVWDRAMELWTSVDPDNTRHLGTIGGIRSGDYSREAMIYGDRVKIGCQTVERWVVEHIARHYNWV